jgi:hypothetical protein
MKEKREQHKLGLKEKEAKKETDGLGNEDLMMI